MIGNVLMVKIANGGLCISAIQTAKQNTKYQYIFIIPPIKNIRQFKHPPINV